MQVLFASTHAWIRAITVVKHRDSRPHAWVSRFLIALGLVCTLLFPARASAAQFISTGFQAQEFGGNLDVVAMAIADDGRVFVAEKAGRIRVIHNNVLLPTPLIDKAEFLSAIDNTNECGLIGITLDPAFSTNHYLYVHYTCAASGTASAFNRVSRITEAGNRLVPGSEMRLLDIEPLGTVRIHNGGALNFGADGMLYVAVGNNGSASKSQSLSSLFGKMLRIKPNEPSVPSSGVYNFPADNPYQSVGTVTGKNKAIYAYGFRNPFSAAVQPVSGRLFANDVGENAGSWEEINDVKEKRNYGWTGAGSDGLHATSDGTEPPLFTYHRNARADSFNTGNNFAITGGAFYNPDTSNWPLAYRGKYFFCDYGNVTQGWIRFLDIAALNSPKDVNAVTKFIANIDHPLDIKISRTGDLYYLARGSAGNTSSTFGKVVKVTYVGGTAPVPTKLAITSTLSPVGANVTLANLTVEVRDSGNVRVTTATNTVTIALGANPGGATLNGTKTVAAIGGLATFTNLSVSKPGTGYTLVATSGTLTSSTSTPFNILGTVAAPVITPTEPTWSGPVRVTMSCATPGAVIHYLIVPTGDTRVPDAAAPLYVPTAPPIVNASNTTVKAIAMAPSLVTSTITQVTYTSIGTEPYGLPFRPARGSLVMSESAPPALLSATGLLTSTFPATGPLAVSSGLIPYQVNSPLWSDGATKFRWMSLPDGARITFRAKGEWTFPGGTVFVKHFDLPISDVDPSKIKRLETRVLVVKDADPAQPGITSAYGLTYKWRADGSDADLIQESSNPDGIKEDQIITTSSGTRTQTWHYPSRAQCLECHTTVSGVVLGPKTRQLNGSSTYSTTGISDNQLRTWNYLGLFTSNIGDAPAAAITTSYDKLVPVQHAVGDSQVVLQERVKSYLDSNCAQCHRPGGLNVSWDARYETPLANQGLIGVNPIPIPNMATDSKLIQPRDLALSWLYQRVHATSGPFVMPPIGRSVRDEAADGTIAAWIMGLPPIDPPLPPLGFITPSPANKTVPNGTTLQFTAVAKRVGGATITPSPPFTWSVEGTGGTITSSGLFTAKASSGSVKVWVTTTVEGVTKTASVYAYLTTGSAPQFAGVRVTPAAIAVTNGTTTSFTALALDQTGAALNQQPSFTWTASGVGGSISPAGLFAATANTGTVTITASATINGVTRTGNGTVTLSAAVRVFTSVRVLPSTSVVAVGSVTTFSAAALDQDGSALASQPSFIWSTTGGGSLSSTGAFSATTAGGPFAITATATVAGITKNGSAGITVTQSTVIQINFQPAFSPTVSGYLVDSGRAYGDRGNGHTYGWVSEGAQTPIDISSTARDRNLLANQLQDTLVHMQKSGLVATWKIAIPNGTYRVFLVGGDPKDYDSVYRINVAGILAVFGVPSASGPRLFETADPEGIEVVVNDGFLRMTNASGALNNKVCYIEIARVVAGDG